MGTYLSTPVLDKCQESGSDLEDSITPVSWGVVDMQGWRKSMEDAHVAKTNLPLPPLYYKDEDDDDPAAEEEKEGNGGNTKVFAVFDGHGGPEVARFCQLYLVNVLLSRKDWAGCTAAEKKMSSEEEEGGDGGNKLNVGNALVDAFHSLDRMIDDENRRQELGKLRIEKPSPGETRTIEWPIPPTKDIFVVSADNDDNDDDEVVAKDTENNSGVGDDKTEENTKDDASSDEKDGDAVNEKEDADDNNTNEKDNIDNDKDDDDDDDIGEPKDKINDESDEENDEKDEKGVIESNSADTMSLFHRLLNMKGGAAEDEQNQEEKGGDAEESKPDETHDHDDDNNNNESQKSKDDSALPSSSTTTTDNSTPTSPENTQGPCASKPTKILNGRQVCNLPDHPIHAGCTAVVAVLINRTVYVANAGDSRAVLCRKDGITEPLSFDHKPLQDIEMNRIKKAGGFVNQFGRVNGNLNLSRSIGDLKYKQVPGIVPAGQMITAEPDIMKVTLNEGDEFIILGCDGIWDCLTNEQAVQYVRSRIDTKTPTEIGIEMLDEIISDDPRVTQGIGGDNMTMMIIDLLPHTRSTALSSLSSTKESAEEEGGQDGTEQ